MTPIACVFTALLSLLSFSSNAVDIEITPTIGYMLSPTIVSNVDQGSMSIDDNSSFGLGIAWQDSPHGQGQILINYVSRDYISDTDSLNHSFDTLYTHFNGIAQFRQQSYITTVSIGLGATYFSGEQNNELYPSVSAAIGTRYEFSTNLAFVTELRSYATLIKNDSNLFCVDSTCYAQFDGSIWLDTNINFSLAYKF